MQTEAWEDRVGRLDEWAAERGAVAVGMETQLEAPEVAAVQVGASLEKCSSRCSRGARCWAGGPFIRATSVQKASSSPMCSRSTAAMKPMPWT